MAMYRDSSLGIGGYGYWLQLAACWLTASLLPIAGVATTILCPGHLESFPANTNWKLINC